MLLKKANRCRHQDQTERAGVPEFSSMLKLFLTNLRTATLLRNKEPTKENSGISSLETSWGKEKHLKPTAVSC